MLCADIPAWLDDDGGGDNEAQDDDEDLKSDPIAQIDMVVSPHFTLFTRYHEPKTGSVEQELEADVAGPPDQRAAALLYDE